MKVSLLLGFILGIAVSAFGWEVSEVPMRTNLRHGEWELTINEAKISVAFDRVGSPGGEEGRLNQVTILSNKGGKKKKLAHIEARVTEDISIPENWAYLLTNSSGKEYALIILRYSSDGEDPTLKPIFIVTDGQATEVKKYEFDEKYSGSGKTDILTLLSKISKEPVDQKLRDAVNGITLEFK